MRQRRKLPSARLAAEPYIRHARLFGDMRSVWDTAWEDHQHGDLVMGGLAYLCVQLRRGVKPHVENEGFWTGVGRSRKFEKWPTKLVLTPAEKVKLAEILLMGFDVPYVASVTGVPKRVLVEKMREHARMLGYLSPVG